MVIVERGFLCRFLSGFLGIADRSQEQASHRTVAQAMSYESTDRRCQETRHKWRRSGRNRQSDERPTIHMTPVYDK